MLARCSCRHLISLALLALIPTCGGQTTAERGSGGTPSGSGGSGASGGNDSGVAGTSCVGCPPGCPAAPPAEGDACSTPLQCVYGTCPIIPAVLSCSNGVWQVGWSPCSPECPAYIPPGGGHSWSHQGAVCTYVDPCCGGTTTWTYAGGWKAESPRCKLPLPPFPDDYPPTTKTCPICVEQQTQKSFPVCAVSELHTLQCIGGTWSDMVTWDWPCMDQ